MLLYKSKYVLASQKFVLKSAEVIFDVKKHTKTLPGKEALLKEVVKSRQHRMQGNQNILLP
jgi:hypothetical protein